MLPSAVSILFPSLFTFSFLQIPVMLHREIPSTLFSDLVQNDGTVPDVPLPSVTKAAHDALSFPKVELHLHMDGSVRFETLLDLSKKRGIPIGNATTVEELKKLIVTHTPASLKKVLEAFDLFIPVIYNDLEAIERIAYELCEDQAKFGVVYFEARYSPHLLFSNNTNITGRQVVEAVHRGLSRGKDHFAVEGRQILCMLSGLEQFNPLVLELVSTCRELGVVGVDVAGTSHGAEEKYDPSVIAVFQKAKELGIHRTAHAGESGGSKEVLSALNDMHAERIGHGYRILRDEAAYRENFLVQRRAHLEACPYSSVMTGAVALDWQRHPIARWAADGADFSVSRDDPTCFDNTPDSELELVHSKIGLSIHQIWQAQLNGARASFAEEPLKSQIVQRILAAEPPNK